MSLLLAINRFHVLFWCFHCWLCIHYVAIANKHTEHKYRAYISFFEQVFTSPEELNTYFSILCNSVNYTLAFMKIVKSHVFCVALAIAEIYSTNAEEQLGPPQTFKMENVSTIAKSCQCYTYSDGWWDHTQIMALIHVTSIPAQINAQSTNKNIRTITKDNAKLFLLLTFKKVFTYWVKAFLSNIFTFPENLPSTSFAITTSSSLLPLSLSIIFWTRFRFSFGFGEILLSSSFSEELSSKITYLRFFDEARIGTTKWMKFKFTQQLTQKP